MLPYDIKRIDSKSACSNTFYGLHCISDRFWVIEKEMYVYV